MWTCSSTNGWPIRSSEALTKSRPHANDRLRNTAEGLASSLRTCGTGTQDSLWDRLAEIHCPTLVLVGEHDTKFRALGDRLVAAIPDSRLTIIADSGHSVHLEAPQATAAALSEFLG